MGEINQELEKNNSSYDVLDRYGISTFPEASFLPKLAQGQAYVQGQTVGFREGKVFKDVNGQDPFARFGPDGETLI